MLQSRGMTGVKKVKSLFWDLPGETHCSIEDSPYSTPCMTHGAKSAGVAWLNENLPGPVPVKEGDFLMPESEKRLGLCRLASL